MSGQQDRPAQLDGDIRSGEAALDWARSAGAGARVAERARRQRRKRQQVRQAMVASAAAVLLAAGLWWWEQPRATGAPLSPAPAALVVSAPERQVLPDGSVVELRPGARIALDFGPTLRRVRLEQGEAHFAVAKNKDAPFVVRAGTIEVRAVGTEFAVDLGAQRVDVLVTEGRVAIERPAGTTAESAPLALLDAGQAIAVPLADEARPEGIAVPPEEQRARLAWRVPRIELSSTPLAEIVACFNRHGAVRLELADPALGALQLSGVLRPDSPHALLHVLRSDFGLHDERRADGTIVIRKR